MIRRKLKNVIKNYTECEILVREATSNEPWGPTNSILSKIAEFSNNEPNIIQIMPLIWKRLKDKGRKWRHVYKSLLLLLFLVTRGNVLIAEYVRRNIHFIQSLETFTYTEGNVDVGSRIRKRASELIMLLKDNDLLKSERQKGLLTDMRFSKDVVSQGSNVPIKYGNGIGSLSQGPSTGSFISSNDNKDSARIDYPIPTTSVEEDIQLQIALAESKEEADRLKKTDEIVQLTDKYKMDLAMEKNLKENSFESEYEGGLWNEEEVKEDVISKTYNDPWSPEPEKKIVMEERGLYEDPWSPNIVSNESLWSYNTRPSAIDPWTVNDACPEEDYWASTEVTDVPNESNHRNVGYNPWSTHNNQTSFSNPVPRKVMVNERDGSVTKFLADHNHLVNIDSLVPLDRQQQKQYQNNPFLTDVTKSDCHNPFMADDRLCNTKETDNWPSLTSCGPDDAGHNISPDPLSQCKPSHYNPFLT